MMDTDGNSSRPEPLRRARELARKAVRRLLPNAPWPVRPVILLYHRVADEPVDPWGNAVRPELFEGQMEWLARNRTVLPLSEFVRLHEAGKLPREAVAITFDDGYASVGEVAAPILERLGLTATLFVPAALVGRDEEFWWDELERLIIRYPGDRLECDGQTFEVGSPEPGDGSWPRSAPPATRRQQVLRTVATRIQAEPPDQIGRELARLRAQSGQGAKPRPTHRRLSGAELRKLNAGNIRVGSHALTHSSLPTLAPAEQCIEIEQSIAACEAITGERPLTFAYPYGDYDERTEELVRSSGFACACTVDWNWVGPACRSWTLPRIGVANWSPDLLARVLLEL